MGYVTGEIKARDSNQIKHLSTDFLYSFLGVWQNTLKKFAQTNIICVVPYKELCI